jgi:hypothetical protein
MTLSNKITKDQAILLSDQELNKVSGGAAPEDQYGKYCSCGQWLDGGVASCPNCGNPIAWPDGR